MQPTVSHDKVSTEKLEKKKKVVKDTAAFKKKNWLSEKGYFLLEKILKNETCHLQDI